MPNVDSLEYLQNVLRKLKSVRPIYTFQMTCAWRFDECPRHRERIRSDLFGGDSSNSRILTIRNKSVNFR